jgi:FADH2 O2-dependent halogenase
VVSAFDIAVIGSGFAGSLTAMIARKLGRSVVLLEKGKHPRFAIGESSTPLANLILEELSERYDLPAIRPLTKWGAWQNAHPEIACGLKRGFTFFHHEAGRAFHDDESHRKQLLVAASPNDCIADTHWYRPDFDAFLVAEARRLGVTYLDETDLWGVDVDRKRPVIQGRHRGLPLEIHAELIIDASGPRGFLHRALALPEVPFKNLPSTEALYTHFTDVKRWNELRSPNTHPRVPNSGAYAPEFGTPVPPYRVDDAAMHHVFEGGWIWVLRFNNGVTSAGAACRRHPAGAREGIRQDAGGTLNFAEGATAWQRLLERFPSVREQFADAKATLPFIHAKQLSFLSGDVAGRNWVLLPSAAGFIDPLLSTGFPLTLLGIERLAQILETKWGREDFSDELFQYSMQTTVELVTTERLIAALYATMQDFELFSALTLLYFAAASFTEAARRLGRPDLAGNTFLLGEHLMFAPRYRDCVAVALRKPTGEEREKLLENIQKAIEPVNIAALGLAQRRNWYPALASDLFAAAEKLQSSQGEIEAMLERCGFAAAQARPQMP